MEWFLLATVVVVICLTAYSIYLTMRPREGPWERLVKCSEMSQAMAETAILYTEMGMDEDANNCWSEAQRLNEEVMAIMTGGNNGTDVSKVW